MIKPFLKKVSDPKKRDGEVSFSADFFSYEVLICYKLSLNSKWYQLTVFWVTLLLYFGCNHYLQLEPGIVPYICFVMFYFFLFFFIYSFHLSHNHVPSGLSEFEFVING